MNAVDQLKEYRKWVGWEEVNGDKIPVDPTSWRPSEKQRAKTNDQSTWASFSETLKGCKRLGLRGFGFVLTDGDPFVCIDLDKCRDPDSGKIDENAKMIIQQLCSYTEISPSGRGFHVWVKASLPTDGMKKDEEGLEIYQSGRYMTFTGDPLDQPWVTDSIKERQDVVDSIVEAHFDRNERTGFEIPDAQIDVSEIEHEGDSFALDFEDWGFDALKKIDPDVGYKKWFAVGAALHHEYDGAERGFQVWDRWSSKGSKYDETTEDGMRSTWRSLGSANNPYTSKTIWKLAETFGWKYSSSSKSIDITESENSLQPETEKNDPDDEENRPKDSWSLSDNSFHESDDEDWSVSVEGDLPEEPPVPIYNYADLWRDKSPYEPDLVSPGVIGPGDMMMTFGPPKSMKTYSAMEACRTWSRGDSWFGLEAVRPLKIAYLNFELKKDAVRERSHQTEFTEDQLKAMDGNFFVSERFVETLDKKFVKKLVISLKVVMDSPPDILVIDPVANFFPGEDENDNQEVSSFIRDLRNMAKTLSEETAVFLIHHTSKAEYDDPFSKLRGASSYRGAYDTGMYIEQDQESGKVTAQFEYRNSGEGPSKIELMFNQDRGRFESYQDQLANELAKGEDVGGGQTSEVGTEREQHEFIVKMIRKRAREGYLHTASEFSHRFENYGPLNSKRTIRRRLAELMGEEAIALFDGKKYGFDADERANGHMTVEGMSLKVDSQEGKKHIKPEPEAWMIEENGEKEIVPDRIVEKEITPAEKAISDLCG